MDRNFRREILDLVILIFMMWIFFFISQNHDGLYRLGIIPRSAQGVLGVILAPLLHASLVHIIQNTILLTVLGTLYCLLERMDFSKNCIFITIISGVFAWSFGKRGIHIGASGLIFGLWTQLILATFYAKQFKYFLVSVLASAFFSVVLFQVVPNNPGISWELHVGGMIAGLCVAKDMGNREKIIIKQKKIVNFK